MNQCEKKKREPYLYIYIYTSIYTYFVSRRDLFQGLCEDEHTMRRCCLLSSLQCSQVLSRLEGFGASGGKLYLIIATK